MTKFRKKKGKSMKFLVTGGSGFLGINIIRFLLNHNHKVNSLDINDFDYNDVKNKIIHKIGDIRDSNVVNEIMEGVDIVIHTAAALPLYSEQEIFSTDILALLKEMLRKLASGN